VVLIGIVAGFGVTVIEASGPAVTMTVAVTVMPLHVTVTVFVKVPAVVPAVNSPACVIVPPPATTAQVGVVPVIILPFASFVTTVNCCVPPTGTVAEVGVRVSDDIGLKSVLLEHAAMNSTVNTLATITRAMRAR
jgi:hypothetical protein